MKRIHKDQRGLTIIELLVVIVLTALITTAVTTTFFQVFNMNIRTTNHMSAISQVQQAGKIVSQDILQAENATAVGGLNPLLTLIWTEIDGETEYSYEITYSVGDNELWRSETIDGGAPTMTRVAEYIDQDPTKTSCEKQGTVLIFTVTATVGEGTWGEESETRIYRVQPRPGT